MGRAGVGKTTIKNIIFEGADPKVLALKPLEPTRGINTSVYKWLDLEVAIFDTSGQELPFILENEELFTSVFTKSTLLVYITDYTTWTSNPTNISEEIQHIQEKVQKIEKEIKIAFFLHKVDLISQKYIGDFNALRIQLKELSPYMKSVPVYFTSISPKLIFSLYAAFSDLLTSFSSIATKLKMAIDSQISKIPKTIGIITNKENKSIVQSATKDFNPELIYPIQKTLSTIDLHSEELHDIDQEFHLIDIGCRLLNLALENIESISPDFKTLFFLSETKYRDQLEIAKSILKNELEKIIKEGGI